MSVKRYNMMATHMQGGGLDVVEEPRDDGDWVKTEDYAALEAKHAALKVRLAAAIESATEMRNYIEDQGLGIDSGSIEDCQGCKCRRSACIACFGAEHVHQQPEARNRIGHAVLRFDAITKETT